MEHSDIGSPKGRAKRPKCCPPSTQWSARLRGALDALGIEGAAHILLVPGIPGPAALQWRKPLILLPPAALDWPADRVRVVLLHELAHLKRGAPRRNWLDVAGIAFIAISVDLAAPAIIDDADTALRLTADPFPGNP